MKKGTKHTPETIEKLIKSHTGLKQSIETIEKRMQKVRGRTHSPEKRRNMSEGAKGRKFSEKHIENLSISHKGKFCGELSPSWKGGKPKCLTCGKSLSSYKAKHCKEHFRTVEWSIKNGNSRIGHHPRSEFPKGHIPKSKGMCGKDSPVWMGGRRIVISKYKSKRKRELGFIPLNDYFENSEGHHLDKEHVLYIPEELHKSVYHNVYTNQGMNIINEIAIDWYINYYGLI